MTETEKAYIAGIIDGEGHIGIHGRGRKNTVAGYTLRVNVAMTDPSVIHWLHRVAGCGSLSVCQPRNTQRLVVHAWRVTSRQALALLREIRPYLILKARHAVLAEEFYASISTRDINRDRRKYLHPDVAAFRLQCVAKMHTFNMASRTIKPLVEHNPPADLMVPYR